jgi:hypothetical protein
MVRSKVQALWRTVGATQVPLAAVAFQATDIVYPQRTHSQIGNIQIMIENEGNITGASAQLIIAGAPGEDGNMVSMVTLPLTGGSAISDGHIVQRIQIMPQMQAFVLNAGFTSTAPTILVYLQE